MGKRNRQRRADTRRAERRSRDEGASNRRFPPPWAQGNRRSDPITDPTHQGATDQFDALPVDHLLRLASSGLAERRSPRAVELLDRLARRAADATSTRDLAQGVVTTLTTAVSGAWERGWQPADLVHVVGRKRRTTHRRLCGDVVAAEATSYRHHPGADPSWLAQVDAVAPRAAEPSDPPAAEAPPAARTPRLDAISLLEAWVEALGSLTDVLVTAAELLGSLLSLSTEPRLVPPPSAWGRSAARPTASRADPKMTERVRALLAKAESTTFPDEAEAFTAKAQELIARYAIDLAMLESDRSVGGETGGRRILIDDPYGRAKSILVGIIASANRCRAVFSGDLGYSTVFGGSGDVDAVELLFTSLLTQATAAMAAAGRDARTRGRSFRQSFLVAYAYRIGERLQEATNTAVDEARERHGDNVLPVLASREAAAEAARDETFPHLRRHSIRASSHEGWAAGRAAAELARLGPDAQLRAG